MAGTPLDEATRIADEVLRPTAETTDQASAIPAGHLALLAEAGLFGMEGAPAAEMLETASVAAPIVERRRAVAATVVNTVAHRLLMTSPCADGARLDGGTVCMAAVFR